MSRRIKTYPFNQEFNDEIAADADSIKDLKLPGAYVECISVATGQKEIMTLRTDVYALEESKGIHLQLVEEDDKGNETGRKSDEVIIDEIKFCNAIHEAVINKSTIERDSFVKDIITSTVEEFARSKVSGDKWLCTVNYDGFGVIRSGDTVIGTCDRTVFEKDKIILDYCVGNFNLNNIIDCNIFFKAGDKCYKLSDIKMKSVTSANDYYCTYTIEGYKGEFLHDIPIDDSVFKDFVRYSDDTAEQFVEQRISIIDNGEEEQDNSYLDDIL